MRRLNDREMLCKRLDIIPVETVVRNIVAGSMAKRLGREEGEQLTHPIVEYYYKSDPLDDPLIIAEHAIAVRMGDRRRNSSTIDAMALKVNDVLSRFLDERGVILVDFKLEFGRHHGEILLGDEICPDTCRFWDKATLQETRQGSLPPRPRRRRGAPITRCCGGCRIERTARRKFRARNARRL